MKDRVIFWLSTGFIFLFEGMMPLATWVFAPQYVNVGTKPLGYPDYFAYALIVCKIVGVLGLVTTSLPSRQKEWIYAGFTFNVLFATLSHLVVDGPVFDSFFPLLILAVLAVSYHYNFKLFSTAPSVPA